MRRRDRKWLYSVVGFFGGIIFLSMVIPSNYEYKTLFTIIGGILTAFVGYSIATR